MDPPRDPDGCSFSLSPEPFLQDRVKNPYRKEAHTFNAVIPDARMLQRKSQVYAVSVSTGHISFGKMYQTGDRD